MIEKNLVIGLQDMAQVDLVEDLMDKEEWVEDLFEEDLVGDLQEMDLVVLVEDLKDKEDSVADLKGLADLNKEKEDLVADVKELVQGFEVTSTLQDITIIPF